MGQCCRKLRHPGRDSDFHLVRKPRSPLAGGSGTSRTEEPRPRTPPQYTVVRNCYFFLAELFAFWGLVRLGAAFWEATFFATTFFLGAAFFLDAGAFLTAAFFAAFFLAFGAVPIPTLCARLPSAVPTAIATVLYPSSSSTILVFANILSGPERALYGRTIQ
jgi:hypothetical protein